MNLTNEKIYVKTYFRINTPAYNYNGWSGNEGKNNFNEEVTKILSSLGFTINQPKFSGSCYEATRGKENLYCHPQNISGELKEESILEIEAAFSNTKYFNVYNIDKYDNVYDLSKDETLNILKEKHKQSTIETILKVCKTTRKNKFVSVNVNSVPVKTIDEREGKAAYCQFVKETISELVEQGLLKKMNSEAEYYRTLNKTELKQWEKQNGKLAIAV